MIPFFIIFVAFLVVVTYSLKKNSRLEQEKIDLFHERERLATSTRKKDISNLPYLSIPLDTFPIGMNSNEQLRQTESALTALAEKKILNLTGKSNTDLKIEYGIANFEFLTQYDDNFIQLITILDDYGRQLVELGQLTEAITVLQFAINCGSDIVGSYTLLAQLYQQTNQEQKIRSLIATAEILDSPRKSIILEKLA